MDVLPASERLDAHDAQWPQIDSSASPTDVARLGQSESANAASTEMQMVSRPKPAAKAGFNRLPQELRDMILRHSLVCGRVYPFVRGDWDRPNMSLLAVNRDIAEQGPKLVFGENVFVIENMESIDYEWMPEEPARSLIRYAELPLSSRKSPSFLELACTKNYYISMNECEPENRLMDFHRSMELYLQHELWRIQVDTLARLTLLHLKIDFSEAYCCPFFCRRRVEHVASLLHFDSIPHEVDIVGLRDEDEAHRVQAALFETNRGFDWSAITVKIWTLPPESWRTRKSRNIVDANGVDWDLIDPPEPYTGEWRARIHWCNAASKVKPAPTTTKRPHERVRGPDE